MRTGGRSRNRSGQWQDADVYAEVYPEDKFRLSRTFQDRGHVVAMCGDGLNDAPALRQAQAGIAVATATDVARAAAAVVLAKPGFNGIVTTIIEARCALERLTTYVLNALAKKFHLVLFLAAGRCDDRPRYPDATAHGIAARDGGLHYYGLDSRPSDALLISSGMGYAIRDTARSAI
ncbi:HAD-IC family P-type ATPase (plasmid) [Burkholderia sp. M6-3]